MNPIGINLWNWTGDFNQSKIEYINKAAKLGYTAIEIGVENAAIDPIPIKEAIENNNLQVTLCAAMTKGKDISNFDEQIRENTKEYMRKCFLLGKEIGSKLFVGPVYAGGAKAHLLSRGDKRKEWELAVTGLREMAEAAAEWGISIAIEPLNRYRTSVVNTLEQALQMVYDINKDNVGILYDTYQANIEEEDIYEPLKTICKAGKLLHVQLSDSNRGAPGMGHIDFKPVFEILKAYDYKGHITVETFTEGVFDSGWIVLDTPDNVAKIGMETIKQYI
jgi:D-psicose/D-tagatose/L-ribulose 3-epimerase|nr:sugar phosphate isomerase/epimerase family protein [uncultured Anaerocolumna sp.]